MPIGIYRMTCGKLVLNTVVAQRLCRKFGQFHQLNNEMNLIQLHSSKYRFCLQQNEGQNGEKGTTLASNLKVTVYEILFLSFENNNFFPRGENSQRTEEIVKKWRAFSTQYHLDFSIVFFFQIQTIDLSLKLASDFLFSPKFCVTTKRTKAVSNVKTSG